MARSGKTRSGRGRQRTRQRLRGTDIGDEALEMVGSTGRSSRDATAMSAQYPAGRAQGSGGRDLPGSNAGDARDRRAGAPSHVRGGRGVRPISRREPESMPGYEDHLEDTMQGSRTRVAKGRNLSADELMRDEDAFNRANGEEAGSFPDKTEGHGVDDEDRDSRGARRRGSPGGARSGGRSGGARKTAGSRRGGASGSARRSGGASRGAGRGRVGSARGGKKRSSRSGSAGGGRSRSSTRGSSRSKAGTTRRRTASPSGASGNARGGGRSRAGSSRTATPRRTGGKRSSARR
jgi:hypothetical protein